MSVVGCITAATMGVVVTFVVSICSWVRVTSYVLVVGTPHPYQIGGTMTTRPKVEKFECANCSKRSAIRVLNDTRRKDEVSYYEYTCGSCKYVWFEVK